MIKGKGVMSSMKFDIKKGINYIKDKNINDIWSMMKYKMSGPGLAYNGWYKEKHETDEEELARQREHVFGYSPLISILVPVYVTPELFLRGMIESVKKQTYTNWELILVDGSRKPENPDVKEDISVYDKVYSLETERIIMQYMETEPRIKYRLMEDNLGVSGNTNIALSMSEGEYMAVLKHDDVLAEDALYHIVMSLQEDNYELIYGDEDRMSADGNKFSNPIFKPDYSPDLLNSYNYIFHFPVVKMSLARAVGGFHSEFDGAQDYDFLLRCVENLTGRIKHIPRILYHWRKNNNSKEGKHAKEYVQDIGKRALVEHVKRLGLYGTVGDTDIPNAYKIVYETPGNPLLSIVISSVSTTEHIKKLISSFFDGVRYSNFEIIVVENNVEDGSRLNYYTKMEAIRSNLHVYIDEDIKTSAEMRRYGASFAKGNYLLFLDSNMAIRNTSSLGYMLGACMREDVGIVTGTLYGENETIYEKGRVLGINGLYSPLHKGLKENDWSYMWLNKVSTNHCIVSPSCMMVKKSVFDSVGGISDKFKTDIGIMDFCLKVNELKFNAVCLADAVWTYKTYEPVVDKGELAKDKDLFSILWGNLLTQGDPYYNKNFTQEGDLFDI